MARPHRITGRFAALAVCSVLALGAAAAAAPAQGSSIPVVHPVGFAKAPGGATHPDDITKLGDRFYVTYQNKAAADGTPTGATSTVVAFDRHGTATATYILTGRCDGLTADPANGRIFASVNEDLNSSLYVITPGAATPLAHYSYSPDPASNGNGGTDSISIGENDTVYVAHSNPDPTSPNPAAVYTLTLNGTAANLTPLFGVNDNARVINPGGGPTVTSLALTDPDSNRFVPGDNGGTLVQDSQADSKLVFVRNLDGDTLHLSQLLLTNAAIPSGGTPTTPQLDDIVRVTGPGTLYVVDQATGTVSTIDTADVQPGTWFVSQPAPKAGDNPNDPALGVVDVQTGVVTHVDSSFGSPKGLLFVPAPQNQNGQGLNGQG